MYFLLFNFTQLIILNLVLYKFQNIRFNRNNVYSDLYSNAIYEITNDNFESDQYG